jgi:uncharacterized protein (DUF1684 family)
MRIPGALVIACVAAVAAALVPVAGQSGADSAHAKEVEAWRARHEADYRRDYVPLAGLFFLKPGPNTVGSAPGSVVMLPKRLPASAGRFVLEGGRIRFEPAIGVRVMLKGKPVSAGFDVRTDGAENADEIGVGDVTFWVHESGDRRAVRLRDEHSETAKAFKGFRWFPVDARYRVAGTFIKDRAPREIEMPLLTGDVDSGTTEGLVEFTLNGARIRMRPITTSPGRLWFIFRDATSGHETYEAARFLYADLKRDGTTILDFNEAYNPPCAFNAFTTCPLPLPENRLAIRLPVGEMAYGGGHP